MPGTVLLDSHVVHWWSAEPARVSTTAATALEEADELAVAAITWFELAWLAAKQLNRKIAWVSDRNEHFLADSHGRDNFTVAEMALDADHKFIGLRADTIASSDMENSPLSRIRKAIMRMGTRYSLTRPSPLACVPPDRARRAG